MSSSSEMGDFVALVGTECRENKMPEKALLPSPAEIRIIMIRYGLLILIMALPCLVLALTLTVKHDGTGDYTLIQEAITASADGDTVLVYPGRYIENVRFNGKNITLASLEILTGDRDYVYSTIIDGNQNGTE